LLCLSLTLSFAVLVEDNFSRAFVFASESKYHWYYEGVDGWWQYDERTSSELELRHQERQMSEEDKSAVFEIVIAGFIYVVDFENGIQFRRGYPRRRRRIKRDLAGIPDCKVSSSVCIIQIIITKNLYVHLLAVS
jgi:WWE domain